MRSHFLLGSFAGLLLAGQASAIQDSNGNGLSDVWERHFNGNALFSTTNPSHAALADPDGDGWSNEKEAIAGTNPFNNVLPAGAVQTRITSNPLAAGVFVVSWPSLEGKTYKLRVSSDLVTWANYGELIPGTNADIVLGVDATEEGGGIPDKLFWRAVIEDSDPDGDTLTSWEELKLGLDPSSSDTDLDGLPDNTDPLPLVSATLADPDGLNLPAGINTSLLAFWDFETQQGTTMPAIFPDRSGNNRVATSSFDGPVIPGMPSKSASVGTRYFTTPATILESKSNWTISGWLRIEKGVISNSPVDAQGDGIYRAVYALYDLQGKSPQGHQIGQGNGLFLRRATVGERWMVGGYEQTTHANGNANTIFAGTGFTLPLGSTDDGEWHQFVVTRKPGSLGQKVYLDSTLVHEAGPAEKTAITYGDADTKLTFGRLYSTHTASSLSQANVDRVRIHGRDLDSAEVTALFHQDVDSDGLWDITEVGSSTWRDTNSNGTPEFTEFAYDPDPLRWSPPGTDSDRDGLTDLEEQTHGTKISNADTDGDLMPDGWEIKYGLNPLNPADTALDNDIGGGDGLSNLDEYRYNSDPKKRDSDGDDKIDGIEARGPDGNLLTDDGSSPSDPRDGGLPLPPNEQVSILLGIGDQSGSHSEDYVLNVARIDSETGEEVRLYTLRSGGHGEYKEETRKFRKGDTLTFQMQWNGTNNNKKPVTPSSPGTEGPDFDYTFKVQPQGSNHGGLLVDSWDRKEKKVDTTKPLLAVEANDVATTQEEFRKNYVDKRVVFYSIQTHSDDRMFAGAATILPGFEQL